MKNLPVAVAIASVFGLFMATGGSAMPAVPAPLVLEPITSLAQQPAVPPNHPYLRPPQPHVQPPAASRRDRVRPQCTMQSVIVRDRNGRPARDRDGRAKFRQVRVCR